MYLSIIEATGNGSAVNVAVPPHITRAHIQVLVDGLPVTTYEWLNESTVRVTAGNNSKIRVVRRTSPATRLTDYIEGTTLGANTLDIDSLQAFYMAQEAYDAAVDAQRALQGAPTIGGWELTEQGILDLLNGNITLSQLALELRSEIGLIQGDDQMINSPAWRVKQEALARMQANQQEQDARIAALQAEALNREAAISEVKTELQTADESLAQLIQTTTANLDGNIAAVQQEVQARVTEDEALAQSIETMVADLGDAHAAIEHESEVRSEADNAIASAVETIRVDLETADGQLSARIDSERDARVNADSAAATDITILKAQIGGGDNLFPNPTFARSSNTPGLSDEFILDRAATGVPAGCPSARLYANDRRGILAGGSIPVQPGEVLEVECWVGVASAVAGAPGAGLLLKLFDQNGNATDAYPGAFRPLNFSDWKHVNANITIPAGCYFFQPLLWTDRDSAAGQQAVYFAVPIVKRKAASVAAVEVSSAAVVDRVLGVEANYTIKVQARSDGKLAMAGIGLNAVVNNQVAQSEMVFMADKFTFVPSMANMNDTPQPLFVAGVVNGQNTFVMPTQRFGDKLFEARMIVDGAIEARHMKITGSTGANLVPDPKFMDESAWRGAPWGGGYNHQISGSGPAFWAPNSSYSVRLARRFPVVIGRRYKVRCEVYRDSEANGTAYLRIDRSDSDPKASAYAEALIGVEGVIPPANAWTTYSGEWVADANFASPMVLINYGGSAGNYWATNVRFEEMLDSSLIVEGGISADRIDTRGLTVRDYAGNILFGVAQNLDWSRITANGGWLNNNITVSGGQLQGIGTAGVQVDNSYAAIGQNLVPNSELTSAMTWTAAVQNGATMDTPLRWSSDTFGAESVYTLRAATTRNVTAHQAGNTGGGNSAPVYDCYPMGGWGASYCIPVRAGQRYCWSYFAQAHRCNVGGGVSWFAGDGSFLGHSFMAETVTLQGGARSLDDFDRLHLFVTPPAYAVGACVWTRKYNTWAAESESWYWAAAPQFEAVGANAQGPSPYMPGPATSTRQLGYSGDLDATRGAPAGTYVGSNLAQDLETLAGAQAKADAAANNATSSAAIYAAAQAELARLNARAYADGLIDAEEARAIEDATNKANAAKSAAEAAAALDATAKANVAATLANWSGVTGTGKPEDYATNGAPSGSYVAGDLAQSVVRPGNQITAANVSTYIQSAAIGAAYIGVLTAGNLTITAIGGVISGGATSGGRIGLDTNKMVVYDTYGTPRTITGYLL